MPAEKLIKLLETATRNTTPPNERLVALDKVRQISDRQGGLSVVFGRGDGSAVTPAPQYESYSGLRRQVELLQRRFDAGQEQVAELTRQLRDRDAKIASLQARAPSSKVASDGSMSYTEFAAEARKRLINADRNWQMVFEEQTGLKRTRFARFCTIGKVDRPEYIVGLDKLRAVVANDRYTKAWTKDEVERVRELTRESNSEKDIASILAREFDRRITENMLKRLKHNSRNGQGVFRDPAYGPPIGSSR